MTASTLTHLPLAAGSAIVSGTGRFGIWAIARYMRAPLANTGMLVFATMTAMAGSNALYNQTVSHPAPFFAPSPMIPQPVDRTGDVDVIPPIEAAPQIVSTPQAAPSTASETTGSVPPITTNAVPSDPVGNEEVFAVQKKLLDMGLFQGTVDGYYGPKTAGAIRAFEERNGLTPEGAITPAVVERILGSNAQGNVQTVPATAPAIAPVASISVPAPVTRAISAPEPAATTASVVVPTQPDILIGPVQETTIERAIASATTTIDSLVASLDSGRQAPPTSSNPPIPQASVVTPAPAQQQMPPMVRQAASASVPAPAMVPPVEVTAVETQLAVAPTAAPTAANETLVTRVQRGLASLGFLHGAIDGQPGEATARAIRNFEVYHNYKVTGEVSPTLIDMLVAAGASV